MQTVRDETLRLEMGRPVVRALAVENLTCSTPALSGTVRRSIIEWRVAEPAVGVPDPNHPEMEKVVPSETLVTNAA